jgi:hypothetical protein
MPNTRVIGVPPDQEDTRRGGPDPSATRGRPAVRFDDLRLATALVHAVPAVALELSTVDGCDAVVAHHRLDAAMSPCQLRALVAAARCERGGPALDHIVAMRVLAGVEHLGGGIYRRSSGSAEERWIVTTIPHESVLELLATCPIETPDDAVHARLVVDADLDTVAVCFGAVHRLWAWRLDEIAFWLQAACLVAEVSDP